MTLAHRLSAKSTIAYGYLMWTAYTLNKPYTDVLYLSYKQPSAAKHLSLAKRLFKANPYLELEDLTTADTILHYRDRQGREMKVEAEGMLSFKRGRHPDVTIVDDPLRDPTQKLDLTQIIKLTEVFFQQVMLLPKKGTVLHTLGTSQDQHDLFFEGRKRGVFDWKEYKAEVKQGISQWPEMFSWDDLKKMEKGTGKKAYQKEMLLNPQRSEEAYFKEEELPINRALKNLAIEKEYKIDDEIEIFGGLDIGKKRHPSHLAVGKLVDGRLIQLHSKWMDGWDYRRQLEYCKRAIEHFGIDRLDFDNTRGEFESFAEDGELPDEMIPVTLTKKSKPKMATAFDKAVTNDALELLNEGRQTRQICSTDNDLQAPETAEGHGESFISIGLMVQAAAEGSYSPVSFIDLDEKDEEEEDEEDETEGED